MEEEMEGRIVRRFKCFWAWQDANEEAWLRKMSGEKGLHLKRVSPICMYTFVMGTPAEYSYRLDFRRTPAKEKQAYLQLFEDAGWEHVGQMNNWQYFRKPARAGETPEILTDRESKIEKYRRMLAFFGFFCLFSVMYLVRSLTDHGGYAGSDLLKGAWLVLLVLFGVIIAKLVGRIRKLKTGG
jgi:hypothetical protein